MYSLHVSCIHQIVLQFHSVYTPALKCRCKVLYCMPGVIVYLSITGVLLALGTVDAFLLHYAFNSVIAQGPSVQLVFGLEVW